jgi:hypothetical protein
MQWRNRTRLRGEQPSNGTHAGSRGRQIVEPFSTNAAFEPQRGDTPNPTELFMDTLMHSPTSDTAPGVVMSRLSPSATTMIRMDHTHAMATFHRYHPDTSPGRKQAIAQTLCTALEIHARLEEEIFYPAMRKVDPDRIDRSIPEHNEMRRLIARLRGTRPEERDFDATLCELMRVVIRHVADEETELLPEAERVLGDRRLGELGAEMTKRRFQLATPRAGEIAVNTVRTFPAATLAVTGMLALGAFLAGRALVPATARKPLRADRWRSLLKPARLRALVAH